MADTNKIRFGFKNVYYAIIDESGEAPTWGKPKRWEGARSLTLDAEGEQSNYFADDHQYFVTSSNSGYSGSLTMAYMPDEVLEDIFGYIVTDRGTLAEDANVLPKSFALLCEFSGDANGTRHCFFKCTPSRASTEANTKEESIDPTEQTLDITCSAVESADGNHNWVQEKARFGDSNYETFFTVAPTLPTPQA